MNSDSAQFTVTNSETLKLVHDGYDVLIYEGGWWMKRSDYDLQIEISPIGARTYRYRRHDVGISRDEDTRQLKPFICSIRK